MYYPERLIIGLTLYHADLHRYVTYLVFTSLWLFFILQKDHVKRFYAVLVIIRSSGIVTFPGSICYTRVLPEQNHATMN